MHWPTGSGIDLSLPLKDTEAPAMATDFAGDISWLFKPVRQSKP
jgi:hypothetical protein